MEQYKILFLGPAASGKTTAVRSLCGDNMVDTEVRPTDELLQIKEETTVALDYGALPFGEGKKLHIYGAPGQDRFSFMIEILSKGCLGVILLVSAAEVSANNIVETIKGYQKYLKNTPFVIGLTHSDKVDQASVSQYVESIQTTTDSDVLIVDPRERRDVADLVKNIVAKIIK